jgi:hypothetical protein
MHNRNARISRHNHDTRKRDHVLLLLVQSEGYSGPELVLLRAVNGVGRPPRSKHREAG